MIFHGVQIDLTFCQLKEGYQTMNDVTDKDFQNQDNINKLSAACERSLNGRNVTEWILDYFSDKQKLQVFRDTLRCIKLFALNQGIYSNVLGYLGGIAWALLLTKICMLYPNYNVNRLLERFFFYYHQWPWLELPVLVEETDSNSDTEENYINDKMKIITPIAPFYNSTHNVSISTLKVIENRLKHGYNTMKLIFSAKVQPE